MTTDTSEAYNFDGRDRALLAAAAPLLTKVATAKMTRPAELVSVAKLQHEGQSVYLFPSWTDGHRSFRSHYTLNFDRVEV